MGRKFQAAICILFILLLFSLIYKKSSFDNSLQSKKTESFSDSGGKLTKETKAEEKFDENTTEAEETSEIQTEDTDKGLEEMAGDEMTGEIQNEFYIAEIDDSLFEKMQGKSYKENCTVPREDLRYVHILHKDLEGNTKEGELVCNKYIAEDLLEIFTELYEADYPIEKVRLVDEYDADDELSMEDNNSSCFNFRFISYTTTVSKHGLGLAVDINTLYNPYVKTVNGKLSIEPANAADYVDRSGDFPCKIDENDLAYKLFTEHGFEWGGSWKNSKDYQHFELPDSLVEKLYP